MNRRNAIKNLGLISGGIVLLPSCDFSDEKVSIVLNKLQITPNQEKLLQSVVSSLIPEGDIPGAKTLKVENFVWLMIDDCMTEEKQQSFIKGLGLFDSKIIKLEGKSFLSLNKDKQESVLRKLMSAEQSDENELEKENLKSIQQFAETVKYYAIWGFMQSEYIMTEVMPYQLVPGSYGNCESIDKTKRINVNA